MSLDTSIPLQVKPPQFDNIQDIQGRGLQLRALGRQEQNAADNDAATRTLRDLYRANTSPTGAINNSAIVQGLASAGLGDRIPAVQQENLKTQGAQADVDRKALELQAEKVKQITNSLYSLSTQPWTDHDSAASAISQLVDQHGIPPDRGAEIVRNLPGNTTQIGQYFRGIAVRGLSVLDQIEAQKKTAPVYDEQDRGGVISQGTIDPMTGMRTAGTDIAKTPTPGEKLTAASKAAELAGKVTFTDDENRLMAAMAEHGVSVPAGMRSKDQMKATFSGLLARNPNLTPDDIAEKIATGQINFGAEKKETQTAAGQAGRIAVAQNEIKQFVPIARAASQALPRGEFLPWNKLKQMTEEQLSNPQLVEFKAYMNTLSNAYDQLAARGGTDIAKREHNRRLFDTAQSPQALEAVFKAMETEAAAADAAATAATKRRPPISATGLPSESPAAVPPDIQALLKKHGAK